MLISSGNSNKPLAGHQSRLLPTFRVGWQKVGPFCSACQMDPSLSFVAVPACTLKNDNEREKLHVRKRYFPLQVTTEVFRQKPSTP